MRRWNPDTYSSLTYSDRPRVAKPALGSLRRKTRIIKGWKINYIRKLANDLNVSITWGRMKQGLIV